MDSRRLFASSAIGGNLSNKRIDVENEDLRPTVTPGNFLALKDFYRARYSKSSSTDEYGHIWFQAVLDLLWHLGYEIRKRDGK